MAFKKVPPPQNVPDSPEQLFLELPRRKIPGVLLHQGEIMQAYIRETLDSKDVALQLPTGSGKTLVGLMIGEWRRIKFKERVLYLCSTRQLVNQVVEQANEQYGLSVNGFTKSAADYDPNEKNQYQNADKIAVTTYSSLFNINPFFNNPEVVIADDAHAAENYIASLWSVKIERQNNKHEIVHNAITNILKPHIDIRSFKRLTGQLSGIDDCVWVDKLPTPVFYEIKDQLCNIFDVHLASNNLRYSWSLIRDNIFGCHLYFSSQEILIRPLIPPTWTHSPFENAKQRIFMSATLGEGGDLERLTGRKNIKRLAVPKGWDKQGIGRRFFIFPSLSLEDNQIKELQRNMMKIVGRSVVLVPNEKQKNVVTKEIEEHLKFKLFDAVAIEPSKQPFIKSEQATL